jgi:protein gp37
VGNDTKIQWTDRTWNPTRGCRRVSPGCEACYAERHAFRHSGPGRPYEGIVTLGKHGPRWTGDTRFVGGKLDEPMRWPKPSKVFVDSMSDLFYEGFTDTEIAAVFGVMAACPQHTFQVLTKRPQRAREWFAQADWVSCAAAATYSASKRSFRTTGPWPLPNVWLGVSVEDQQRADERIPVLLELPAAVRFVSAEPLLGPVALGLNLGIPLKDGTRWGGSKPLIDWVIVGGESGPGARPMDLAWARQLVRHCAHAGVPCFVKQLGAAPVAGAPAERGLLQLADRKGGDMAEWPTDLRVRQFPPCLPSYGGEKQEEGVLANPPGKPQTPGIPVR